MNVVLAVALLTGLFTVKYQKLAEPDQRGMIGHVAKDSAAAKAGLQEGDRIVAIDNEKDPTWEDIIFKEISSADRPLAVTVDRAGKRIDTNVTPVQFDRNGAGYAGWSMKGQIEVGKVSPGYPAEAAGLRKGDLLLSANGHPLNSTSKLQEVIEGGKGSPVVLRIERNGKQEDVKIQPVYGNLEGTSRWMIGVGMDQMNVITTKLSLREAFVEACRENAKGASQIFQFLRGVLERRMSARQVMGPIGIAQVSGEAAREGPSAFVRLMSMVSLNLAIFNLLPIPILDGGVILLLLVEMLIGRDLSMPVKEAVIKVGFVFLMVVTVFALYNDISRILPAG